MNKATEVIEKLKNENLMLSIVWSKGLYISRVVDKTTNRIIGVASKTTLYASMMFAVERSMYQPTNIVKTKIIPKTTENGTVITL